jgi:hypothetical protein
MKRLTLGLFVLVTPLIALRAQQATENIPGLDTVNMDLYVQRCNGFYHYANGTRLLT